MENTLLKEAKLKFPKGSLFYSATGNLKTPIRVTSLRVSENYKNTIVNAEFGVIYTNNKWAVKL